MYTAAMLDKERYSVRLISGPQTGSEGSLIETVRDDLGVPLEILPEIVREINPWKDLVALWKLYSRMKHGGYKIVHTHSSKAGILGRLAARLAGVPIIVHTVHGWSFHDRMSSFRRGIYVMLERMAARWSDALIVVAEKDIEKGLQHGIGLPNQYRMFRSAIPLDAFEPDQVCQLEIREELGIKPDVPVLGNVGRLSPQKNPLDWVRVAGRIAEVIPACWFLLVGDGPLRREVETLISEVGIADRTILTGIRRDVPRMLAAMDVFLITSLWEGLPRVIPQSMAMKVPVVANRADGTVEAIDHCVTGFLCDPGSLEEMSDYCVEILQDPKLRYKMGERGRARALGEYDLNVMISEIDLLYETLLLSKGVQKLHHRE